MPVTREEMIQKLRREDASVFAEFKVTRSLEGKVSSSYYWEYNDNGERMFISFSNDSYNGGNPELQIPDTITPRKL